MAVQSDTSRISYAGNNSTSTSYAVPFVFLENSHLKAIAKTSAGVESVVTLTNHTGAGDVNGGTVRTAVAIPATSTLTIYRDVPITQTTTYAEGGDFPAASHERALDKLTQITQQNARQIGSSIRFSEATQINPVNPPVSTTPHVLTTVNGGAPTWETVPSVSFPDSLNALTDATTVNAADELIIQQSGITKRATATEVAAGLFATTAELDIPASSPNQEYSQNGARVHRLADKLLVGGAVAHSGSLEFDPIANRFLSQTPDWFGEFQQDKNLIRIVGASASGVTMGPKTIASISIATGTATATLTAHGYANGQKIIVSGATPSGLNGTHTITVTDANTFTYTTAATGAVSVAGTASNPVVTFTAGGIVPEAGAYIFSEAIPPDTKISTVDSATQITLDKGATASATGLTLWSSRAADLYTGTAFGQIRSLNNEHQASAFGGTFASQSRHFNAAGTSCIGVTAFAVNNHATLATSCWGGYFEAFRINSTVGGARGIEIDVVSCSSGEILPNAFQQSQTACIQLGAGNGLAGELQTQPAPAAKVPQVNIGAAIQVLPNPMRFRAGIVFNSRSIEGTDGYTGTGRAIAMGTGHGIEWHNPSQDMVSRIVCLTGITSAQRTEIRFGPSGVQFFGAGGTSGFIFNSSPTTLANWWTLAGAATNQPVTISSSGTDTNVDLRLSCQGTGVLRFGTHAARGAVTKPTGGGTIDAEARTAIDALIDIIADGTAAGHITIKDTAGNTRKLAVVS
jgi:hypothetical protein